MNIIAGFGKNSSDIDDVTVDDRTTSKCEHLLINYAETCLQYHGTVILIGDRTKNFPRREREFGLSPCSA